MIIQQNTGNNIGVAVDVGSTSIGVCCVDLNYKTEILSFSFANPQHIYGADVVTRIKHCVDDETMLYKMNMMLREVLHEKLREHLKEKYANIVQIVYSGNTTMLYILRELSLDGLAEAPFIAKDIDYAERSVACMNGNVIKEVFIPGFSAFVGADILSGATYLKMGKNEAYELLVDLGTNGELLLLNRERGFATSTACGPVFDHVISGARYGSESLNVIAQCVKRGLIDATGKLADALFDKGISIGKNFTIKQENIRNFQLAKGAIYAGIQCLLNKAGITVNEISKIYISGGLGFHMNKMDAFTVKMLPIEFADKLVICGNTSLGGAKSLLLIDNEFDESLEEKDEKEMLLEEYENIRNRTESFELANYEGFQECYMNSLNF